jgi:hypothetical protein
LNWFRRPDGEAPRACLGALRPLRVTGQSPPLSGAQSLMHRCSRVLVCPVRVLTRQEPSQRGLLPACLQAESGWSGSGGGGGSRTRTGPLRGRLAGRHIRRSAPLSGCPLLTAMDRYKPLFCVLVCPVCVLRPPYGESRLLHCACSRSSSSASWIRGQLLPRSLIECHSSARLDSILPVPM